MPTMVDWNFATTISGEQFVMISLALLMLMLPADSWDMLTLVTMSHSVLATGALQMAFNFLG